MNNRAFRPFRADRVFVRLVGNDANLPSALGRHLSGNLRHRETAVGRLPAGHRHSIIVEDFIGDINPGGARRTDRQ